MKMFTFQIVNPMGKVVGDGNWFAKTEEEFNIATKTRILKNHPNHKIRIKKCETCRSY